MQIVVVFVEMSRLNHNSMSCWLMFREWNWPRETTSSSIREHFNNKKFCGFNRLSVLQQKWWLRLIKLTKISFLHLIMMMVLESQVSLFQPKILLVSFHSLHQTFSHRLMRFWALFVCCYLWSKIQMRLMMTKLFIRWIFDGNLQSQHQILRKKSKPRLSQPREHFWIQFQCRSSETFSMNFVFMWFHWRYECWHRRCLVFFVLCVLFSLQFLYISFHSFSFVSFVCQRHQHFLLVKSQSLSSLFFLPLSHSWFMCLEYKWIAYDIIRFYTLSPLTKKINRNYFFVEEWNSYSNRIEIRKFLCSTCNCYKN